MKACRKLLEEDLGLPEKSLADRKEFIQKYVDKVTDGANNMMHGRFDILCKNYIWDGRLVTVPTLCTDLSLLCTDHSQQSI